MKHLMLSALLTFFGFQAVASINCKVFTYPYGDVDLVRQIEDLGQDFIQLDSGTVGLQSDASGTMIFVSWKGLRSMTPLSVGQYSVIDFTDTTPSYSIKCKRVN